MGLCNTVHIEMVLMVLVLLILVVMVMIPGGCCECDGSYVVLVVVLVVLGVFTIRIQHAEQSTLNHPN